MTGILLIGAFLFFFIATFFIAWSVHEFYGATKIEATYTSIVIVLLMACSFALNMITAHNNNDITPLLLFMKDCLIYILFPLVLIVLREVDDRKKEVTKITANNQTDTQLCETISSLEFSNSDTNIVINGIDGKHTNIDINKSKLIITIK